MRDFGHEAIATIIQEMENRREEVLVIFAGYDDLMKEFLETNPGLASRISQKIRFEDYSPDELYAILDLMMLKKQYQLTDDCKNKLCHHFSELRTDSHFGNARYVRKLVDQIILCQAQRVVNVEDKTYFKQVNDVINSKQLANMKAWMMISMLVDQSDFLGEQNRQAASAFKNVASGLTQIESKEKMLTPN